MVIVHCGRGDVILGILAAIQARGFPAVSGILVTGGSELDPAVESVLQSTENIPLPIMSVQTDTFLTASEIVNMRRKLAASGVAKVEQAISLFERFTDKKLIYSLVDVADHRRAAAHPSPVYIYLRLPSDHPNLCSTHAVFFTVQITTVAR
jgi:phosphate acetyltransferase